MRNATIFRYALTIGLLLSFLLVACAAPAAPAPPAAEEDAASSVEDEPLLLWTYWQNDSLDVLKQLADGYNVEIVSFPQDFDSALDTAFRSQTAPDLFIANHELGNQYLSNGMLAAYCAPPDGCPICETENPPEWCKYATDGDIAQVGIPLDWWYLGAIANEPWLTEQDIALPNNMEEVWAIRDINGLFYDRGTLDFAQRQFDLWQQAEKPDVFQARQLLWPDWQANDKVLVRESVTDVTDVGVFWAASHVLVPLLQGQTEPTLKPLKLADFEPPVFMEGIYMTTTADEPERRAAAHVFINRLADQEAQGPPL